MCSSANSKLHLVNFGRPFSDISGYHCISNKIGKKYWKMMANISTASRPDISKTSTSRFFWIDHMIAEDKSTQ